MQLTVGGTVSSGSSTFTVYISDDTSDPNKFRWTQDGGDASSEVAITTGAQTLADSVTVTFSNDVGYTSGQEWTLSATTSSATLLTSPTQRYVGNSAAV